LTVKRTLRGKVVVVTGASSGVGRAIARAFAAQGARVALVARGIEGLERAAVEAGELGGEALVLPLDVASASAVETAADRVVGEWGAIDVWINAAMVSVLAPVHETTAAEFRRVMEVDYLGYVHGTLAALQHMRARGAGVIIQIGSALAYRSIPLQSAYCASKAAIRAFTDSLRSELLRERSPIALTMLHLPAVNTPQFEVVRNRLAKHPRPVPPVYQPELIAKATVHAALHPRREMWIGASTTRAIIAQRLVPGLLDRYLARRAWSSQQTASLPPGHPIKHEEDNLYAPLPGDRGAHGPFDNEASAFSLQLFCRLHPVLTSAATAVATAAVFALLRNLLGKRSPGRRAGALDVPRAGRPAPASAARAVSRRGDRARTRAARA
jgi:NADP-dependent 3-hydroxy acid dehydrogenase YdfG